MKTILIPTDFSSVARNAMRYASALYEQIPCRYILLNTYNVPPSVIEVVGVSDKDTLEKKAEEHLKKELSLLEGLKHHPQSTFESISGFGDVTFIIKKLLKKETLHLIAMGTTGASGLKEVLMGSNTVAVIENTPIPVLCVPKQKEFSKPKKILLTADFERIKDEAILTPLIEIAHSFQSQLSIFHVTGAHDPEGISVEKSEEAFHLHNYIADLDHEFYSEKSENVEKAIENFASNNQIDLIIALKRKHSLLSRLFNFSMTKKMAYHSELPLLILPEVSDS